MEQVKAENHLAPVLAETIPQMLSNGECIGLQSPAGQDVANEGSDVVAGLSHKTIGMMQGLQDQLHQRSIHTVGELCPRVFHNLQYGLHSHRAPFDGRTL